MAVKLTHRIPPEIPTASMADIAFLLIIFFMLTAVYSSNYGLEYGLPKNEDPVNVQPLESMHVRILAPGQYTIDRVKAGTYYLEFTDPVSGNREFWNDQPGQDYGPPATATPLVVAACESLTGVDAVFGGPAVPTPAVTCVVRPPPVAPQVTNVVRPRVKGSLEVGRVVRVSKGVWKPTAVTFKYQWYAGGKAITDATHRRLALTAKYAGKRLSVRIKAKATGYDRAVVRTKPTARVQP